MAGTCDCTRTIDPASRAPNVFPLYISFPPTPACLRIAYVARPPQTAAAKARACRQGCLETEASKSPGRNDGLNGSSKTGLLWPTPRVLTLCKRRDHTRGAGTPREPMKPPRVS